MTVAEIQKARDKDQVRFNVAIQIRELLEAARKDYGPEDWDADDIETQIVELITE